MTTFARNGIRLVVSTLTAIVVLVGSAYPAAAADRVLGPVTGPSGLVLTVAAALAALLGSAIVLPVVRVAYRLIAIAVRAFVLLLVLRLALGLSAILAIIVVVQAVSHH